MKVRMKNNFPDKIQNCTVVEIMSFFLILTLTGEQTSTYKPIFQTLRWVNG